ncbi:MAG: phasin family protein [Alphaproteobacteria bacterium]
MTDAKSKTKNTAGTAGKSNGADPVKASQDAFENLFRAGTEAMSGNYDNWIALGQENAAAAFGAFKGWDEFADIGKRNAEAMVASGKFAAQGIEDITDKMASFVTATVEDSVESSKEMLECRDAKDFLDLQTKQVRKAIDGWVAEGTEISELSVATATKAFTPLGERVSASVEKWGKTAA